MHYECIRITDDETLTKTWLNNKLSWSVCHRKTAASWIGRLVGTLMSLRCSPVLTLSGTLSRKANQMVSWQFSLFHTRILWGPSDGDWHFSCNDAVKWREKWFPNEETKHWLVSALCKLRFLAGNAKRAIRILSIIIVVLALFLDSYSIFIFAALGVIKYGLGANHMPPPPQVCVFIEDLREEKHIVCLWQKHSAFLLRTKIKQTILKTRQRKTQKENHTKKNTNMYKQPICKQYTVHRQRWQQTLSALKLWVQGATELKSNCILFGLFHKTKYVMGRKLTCNSQCSVFYSPEKFFPVPFSLVWYISMVIISIFMS